MHSLRIALVLAAGIAMTCPRARAVDEVFDFEVLRYNAKMLAAKPFAPRTSPVPDALLKLSYDNLYKYKKKYP